MSSPTANAAKDLSARTWRLYQSANFQIYSDLRPGQVADTITALENFRAAVHYLTSTDPGTSPPHETRLYLFKRVADLRKLHSSQEVLGFMIPGLRYNLMVAAKPPRGSILNTATSVVFHEYVHQLVRSVSSFRYPAWYDEGFAELLSTARSGNGSLIFGQAPAAAAHLLKPEREMPLAEMLNYQQSPDDDPQRRQRFYAKAWLFTHYLLFSPESAENGHRKASSDYLRAYNRGQLHANTFEELFGLDIAAMDSVLRSYQFRVQSFEVPRGVLKVNPDHQQRVLSRDEARYELGSLFLGRHSATANALLSAVDTESGMYPRALSSLGQLDLRNGEYAGALEKQRKALALAPEDYLLHLAIAESLLQACSANAPIKSCRDPDVHNQALAHYARAQALESDRAETTARYGFELMQQGYSRKALPLLQRALELVPGSYQLVISLGIVHLQSQQWEAAEYYLQRAWGWSADAAEERERVASLLAFLDRARSAAQEPPAPSDLEFEFD
ncbi:MAG: tetratricopeptide repeat protein [Pseudomonadales bacterium]